MENMTVEFFTQGKNPPKNEDELGYDEKTLVLADGATDKHKVIMAGKSGGEFIANLVVTECLNTSLNGIALIEHLNKKVMDAYKALNPEAISNASRRPSTTLICARIVNDSLFVTQVGDSTFRINGKDLYSNDKLIDQLNAQKRSKYIQETGDVEGGRVHIMSELKNQHVHLNNPDSELGYGQINGTTVPNKFIRTFKFKLEDLKTIELISDGYFLIPKKTTVEAYEQAHRQVESEDPYKYLKYLSTKTSDDRSVLIATFK